MVDFPALAVFGAVSSPIVAASILYVFHAAYFRNRQLLGLLGSAVTFEGLFIVSYMAYDVVVRPPGSQEGLPAWMFLTSAVHGMLSLVVFVWLVVLWPLAHRRATLGGNVFQERPWMMGVLSAMIVLSLATGEVIFAYNHLR